MAPYSGLKQLDVKLLKFLAEKTENTTTPLVLKRLCELFGESQTPQKPPTFYSTRIFRFRHKIHLIDELDMHTRVKILFAISAPIDSDFVKGLQKRASVKVDEEARLIEDVANDGSLTLRGKHKVLKRRSSVGGRFARIVGQNPRDDDEVMADDTTNRRSSMDSRRSELNNKRAHDDDSDKDDTDSSPKVPRGDETMADDHGPGPSQLLLKAEPEERHENGIIQRELKSEHLEQHSRIVQNDMPTSDVSSKKVLEFLQNLVSTLDCHTLKELERRIEQALGDPEIQNQSIPAEILVAGLESNLYTVRRRATVAGSESLEKFLLILSSTLLYLGSPSKSQRNDSKFERTG
ncbi:hypothetical protein B9Z55_000655 [Caenorhabditis nigoni]|uniref:SPK domain-containing protein n=1 Tax=Caenorhabditis nigoni TaxID=1611254 RepID=A0A2G5VU42_9PELO|nr:hypothetical protein B9Z55_000655 [Caenorhabditis nigoni]